MIDFTLSRLSGSRRVIGWTVNPSLYTGSDHHTVRFAVDDASPDSLIAAGPRPEGWAVRKLDEEKLVNYIRDTKNTREAGWLGEDVDEAAENFHQYVATGCRLSMPGRGAVDRHHPA